MSEGENKEQQRLVLGGRSLPPMMQKLMNDLQLTEAAIARVAIQLLSPNGCPNPCS